MAMTMDISSEQWTSPSIQADQQHHQQQQQQEHRSLISRFDGGVNISSHLPIPPRASLSCVHGSALAASAATPVAAAYLMSEGDQQQEPVKQEPLLMQRADTPCPIALQAERRGAGEAGAGRACFVLLPENSHRRFIQLGAGTTVVGRCKSSGIRDHHVSRRHVEVTVPEEGQDGAREGCCRIKYIGRNCRVVLVGGILLKADQEVPAGPGTKVILNFNNKGLPRYSYTLVPADNLPALATTISARRRAAAGTAVRWRAMEQSDVGSGSVTSAQEGALWMGAAGVSKRQQQREHRGQQQLGIRQQKQRPAGRFRKEAQDKLQKEREDIFSRFADLKFI